MEEHHDAHGDTMAMQLGYGVGMHADNKGAKRKSSSATGAHRKTAKGHAKKKFHGDKKSSKPSTSNSAARARPSGQQSSSGGAQNLQKDPKVTPSAEPTRPAARAQQGPHTTVGAQLPKGDTHPRTAPGSPPKRQHRTPPVPTVGRDSPAVLVHVPPTQSSPSLRGLGQHPPEEPTARAPSDRNRDSCSSLRPAKDRNVLRRVTPGAGAEYSSASASAKPMKEGGHKSSTASWVSKTVAYAEEPMGSSDGIAPAADQPYVEFDSPADVPVGRTRREQSDVNSNVIYPFHLERNDGRTRSTRRDPRVSHQHRGVRIRDDGIPDVGALEDRISLVTEVDPRSALGRTKLVVAPESILKRERSLNLTDQKDIKSVRIKGRRDSTDSSLERKRKPAKKPPDFVTMSVMGCIFNPFIAIFALVFSREYTTQKRSNNTIPSIDTTTLFRFVVVWFTQLFLSTMYVYIYRKWLT